MKRAFFVFSLAALLFIMACKKSETPGPVTIITNNIIDTLDEDVAYPGTIIGHVSTYTTTHVPKDFSFEFHHGYLNTYDASTNKINFKIFKSQAILGAGGGDICQGDFYFNAGDTTRSAPTSWSLDLE